MTSPPLFPRFLGGRYIAATYGGQPCPYCGETMALGTSRAPTKDHIHPQSRGGTTEQVITVCGECNQDKGRMSLPEFAAFTARAAADPRAARVAALIELLSAEQ